MITEPASIHRLKNQLAIIMGFCELLLTELGPDSPHRGDVIQIQTAGRLALEELPPPAGHGLDALDGRPEAPHGE